MSLMVMEGQMKPRGRDASLSKSLMDLIRLRRLRLPPQLRRHTDVADTKAPPCTVTVTAVAPGDGVLNGPAVTTDGSLCVEITNSTTPQPIAWLATLPAPTALQVSQVKEPEDCVELRVLNPADLQCSDMEVLSTQPSNLQPSPADLQRSDTEVLSIQPSELQPLDFERLEADCYAANNMHLNPSLQEIFNKTLRRRISGKLRRLKLNDPRISLELAMIGPKRTPAAMKPTILCMCFTQDQRKVIINALRKMEFIPGEFGYKVIIFELKKSSTENGFSHQGPMIGRTVEIISQKHLTTLCGTSARILLSDQSDDYANSTIGGLIVINKTLYALTSAHGFASTFKGGVFSDAKKPFPEMDAIDSPISPQISTLLGTIHSYVWTDDSPTDELEEFEDCDDAASQDWALVDVQPPHYLENSFSFCDKKTNIDGYIRNKDLTHGGVYVCAGSSGIQKGILSGSTASVIMDVSFFEVRPISLEYELVDGDSGSWVTRDGKLCGYIFCRVVGLPRAYMFPIESVFNEIAQTFPDPWSVYIDVPSGKSVDEINQSTKATPLPAVSKRASTPKQDHYVPHIDTRDFDSVSTTHPRNEEILDVALEGVGASGSTDGLDEKDNDRINGMSTASKMQWHSSISPNSPIHPTLPFLVTTNEESYAKSSPKVVIHQDIISRIPELIGSDSENRGFNSGEVEDDEEDWTKNDDIVTIGNPLSPPSGSLNSRRINPAIRTALTDVTGHREHGKLAPKFGTWDLDGKGVNIDWDNDFEFDGLDVDENDNGNKSMSGSEMLVPEAIQASQANVIEHVGQIREVCLLVEDLKRLRSLAREKGILDGSSANLWREAEGIIALAIPDEDEILSLPPSLSAYSVEREPISDNSYDGSLDIGGISEDKDSSEEYDGLHLRCQSIFSPENDMKLLQQLKRAASRLRGKDYTDFAQSAMEYINKHRTTSDPLWSNTLEYPRKMPFDTTSLRDLVHRANALSRALAEIVRKADGSLQSLHHSLKNDLDPSPAFTRDFTDPLTSPPKHLQRSRSNNSILNGSTNVSPTRDLGKQIHMMTVI